MRILIVEDEALIAQILVELALRHPERVGHLVPHARKP
jgi:hypothetical protein